MAVEPETPGFHEDSVVESTSTSLVVTDLVTYEPSSSNEDGSTQSTSFAVVKIDESPLQADQPEVNTCKELVLVVQPERKYRKKDWGALNMRKPTLRPRKVEAAPPCKKLKAICAKKEKNSAFHPYQMRPPDLPLADSFPVPESSTTEMPLLLSETASNSSETSLTRHRKAAKFSPRKKKFQGDQSKERPLPSPSLADVNVNPACPESSATVDLTVNPARCLCVQKTQVYVSSTLNMNGDITCQALDSLDGRVIGCSHHLPSSINGLHRPSLRTSLIMLCSGHYQRLLRHICCPGCGLYCTQGKFLTCRSSHYYHRDCARQEGCPHCGDTTHPKTVTLVMKIPGNSAFLPKPRLLRKSKPAKISVSKGQPVEPEPRVLINLPPEVEQWNAQNDPPDNQNYTYKHLLVAVQMGDALKMLKIMSTGLNPNYAFPEMSQQTPLHIAASLGHVILVHLLLQSGIPIDLVDGDQHSALSLAIKEGHLDVVDYLVKTGASLLLKVDEGMTPLHLAAKMGNVEACNLLLSAPNVPFRYVDSSDDGGWTPLVWAAEYNHLEVVRYLVKEGSNPLLTDSDHNIALHWAAYGGSLEVVEHLLSTGSDLSAVNAQGDTPLHIAAREDKYNCVLLLLANGARSDVKNHAGHTPRKCAIEDSLISKAIALNEELSQLISKYKTRGPKILSSDISRGRERNPVQCINTVDDAPEPRDFVYVNEYCFTSGVQIERTVKKNNHCSCKDNCTTSACTCTSISLKAWYDSEGKLIPEYSYFDAPMIFECNQLCECNQLRCQNRVVQKGMFCRLQLFRTETRGWGIKTLQAIPQGTFVCEYIGEIITDQQADKREDDSYLFDLDNRDGDTFCVDAKKYGNLSRFINHMCDPNLTPVKVFCEHQDIRFPRMALFANQNIPANTELGYNYGEKFWVIKYKSFTCICLSEKCMYSVDSINSTLKEIHRKQDMEPSDPLI